MRIKLLLFLIFVCLISAHAQNRTLNRLAKPISTVESRQTDTADKLPIRRVILYSNGMVYIERRGIVSGNAEVNLSFKQSQVDDVLKSMIVLDLGKGRIGAVSYNSSVPAAARTAEIPFNIESSTEDNSGGLAGVLSQLQGAKVLVTSAQGTATGSILSVERKPLSSKSEVKSVNTPLMDYALIIASESGEISSFDLSTVRSVKLLDEETKRDVSEFASAAASARRRDAKTINIVSDGTGQREMMVSYTVSAPIWKTTYRVVLDDAGKPFFQGWAIVDNVSDEDWKNVQLSLVSGAPISFIQPIQNPLYRHRPEIGIPEDLSLEPQVYEPGASVPPSVSMDQVTKPSVGYGEGRGSGNGIGVISGVRTLDETVTIDGREDSVKDRRVQGLPINGRSFGNLVTVTPSVSEALISGNSGVQSAAKGQEFGDLFEYKIEQPVSVARNRSALIPIVQTKMDGERVSIYRESAKRDRPMSGMLLNNTSNLTFENGSMTVIDKDAYAGEALMDRLKPKEKRLISFAADLGTLVTVKNDTVREPAKLIKAVNGTFQVHYFNDQKKIYNFTNQTDRLKIIYIEHPIRDRWILSEETPKPFDVTQNNYRFRFELQPNETKTFTIAEQQPLMDTYNISALRRQDLEFFIAQRYVNDATRLKLEQLIDLREQMTQVDAKLRALDDEERLITADQSRLRENIEALTKTPEAKQLITRYISKADEQESRIEAITKERQSLKAERATLEAKLALEIKNFEMK